MGAHERMDAGRWECLAAFVRQVSERARAVFAEIHMHGLQTVDALLCRVWQIVVGAVHVDVLRVAATAGQRDREQRRGFRWRGMVRVVGVKTLAGNDALAIHDLIVGDVVDVRMAGNMGLPLVVLLELTEHLGGLLEPLRRQLLITDHQHMVVGKRVVQLGAGAWIDVIAKVEAAYFRSRMVREGRYRVGHWTAPNSPDDAMAACGVWSSRRVSLSRTEDAPACHCKEQSDEAISRCYSQPTARV